MQQVSIGQACANALARWLRSVFAPDVKIYEKWADANTKLTRAITVLRIGTPRRLQVVDFDTNSAKPIGNGPAAQIGVQIGSIEQPIQLDVWGEYDSVRDDLVLQLDQALIAGIDQTLQLPGDPVRDGILLPLLDGFEGNNCDYWFDDPEIDDTPQSVQRSEYRATYFGEARAPYVVKPNRPVSLITKTVPAVKGSTGPVGS